MKMIIDWEHEQVAIERSITIGRHLDNDLIASGEDVLDYHLRLQPTDRGLTAHPLHNATFSVNEVEFATPVGIMMGDRIGVGPNTGTISVEYQEPSQADSWVLISGESTKTYALEHESVVGRNDEADIALLDDHISRAHARLVNHQQHIWLQDLGSANGTYVNGDKITGAQMLYHGDRVSFDTYTLQLIGRGGDLTPVRQEAAAETVEAAVIDGPVTELRVDTTRVATVDEHMLRGVDMPTREESGACLLGASDPIAGMAFRIPMGRSTIGRDSKCNLVIKDATVSSKHAEIVLRPEGCTITNLLSTNGVRVNSQETQSAQLNHGDVVRLGNVSLVFNDVPKPLTQRRAYKQIQILLIGGSVLLAAGIVWMLS
jgi:pSer/pThr/pTyr-binding forkhead associated (FHA) protein